MLTKTRATGPTAAYDTLAPTALPGRAWPQPARERMTHEMGQALTEPTPTRHRC